jgi:hypothetical protein
MKYSIEFETCFPFSFPTDKLLKIEVKGKINKERKDIIKGKEVRIIEDLVVDSVSFVEDETFDNSMETE